METEASAVSFDGVTRCWGSTPLAMQLYKNKGTYYAEVRGDWCRSWCLSVTPGDPESHHAKKISCNLHPESTKEKRFGLLLCVFNFLLF